MVGTAEDSRHPGDEQLLAYVDGELSWFRRRRVRRHLESCWECRKRTREIESAIAEFVSLRNEWAGSCASGPRTDLRSFEILLDRAELEQGRGRADQSRVQRLGDFLRRWAPPAALAAAALAGAWLWLASERVASVSAAELLERAAAGEASRVAGIDQPVVHRQLEVRRISNGNNEQTARLEYWLDTGSDRTSQRGASGLWSELDAVFEANNMAGAAPLTVEAYEAWRGAARPQREEVTALERPGGEKVFALRGAAAGTGADNEILEHELVVRATDWHPVQQTLRVRRDPGIVEYQFTEIVFDVVPLSSLPPGLFAPPGAPGEALREALVSNLSRPPDVPPVAAGRTLEVKVRYQLHLADACRQDLVRVRFESPARIYVGGIVETLARREELLSALQQLERTDAVRVDIRSVEAASTADELFQALEGLELDRAPSGRRAGPAAPPGPGPLLPLVEEAFGNEIRAGDLARRSHRMTAGALRAASSAVLEGAVLKQLAAAYGGPVMEGLPERSRRLVALMVRDHAQALDQRLARLERVFAPLVGEKPATCVKPAADGRGWAARVEEQAARLADLQARLERMLGPASQGAAAAPDGLRAELTEVRRVCFALRRDLAAVLTELAPVAGLKTTGAGRAGSRVAARE